MKRLKIELDALESRFVRSELEKQWRARLFGDQFLALQLASGKVWCLLHAKVFPNQRLGLSELVLWCLAACLVQFAPRLSFDSFEESAADKAIFSTSHNFLQPSSNWAVAENAACWSNTPSIPLQSALDWALHAVLIPSFAKKQSSKKCSRVGFGCFDCLCSQCSQRRCRYQECWGMCSMPPVPAKGSLGWGLARTRARGSSSRGAEWVGRGTVAPYYCNSWSEQSKELSDFSTVTWLAAQIKQLPSTFSFHFGQFDLNVECSMLIKSDER